MRYVCIMYAMILLCIASCHLSRIYEIRPTETTSRMSFLSGQEMDVVVFDSRTHKGFSVDAQSITLDHLNATYPELTIYRLNPTAFFETPDSGRITLKISLIRHSLEHVDFSSTDDDSSCSIDPGFVISNSSAENQEIAKTIMDVTLYDWRHTKLKHTLRISEKAYEGQLFQGVYYPPLQRSFQRAMDKLCSFIDQQLMD